MEEHQGELSAWEFKWNPKAKGQIQKTFSRAYADCSLNIVTPENFESFIGTE